MFAAVSDTAYDIVLVLHILCAIIGFGGVALAGIYDQQSRARGGSEGFAIFQANLLVTRVASYFIYAVFLLGILLVLLSDDVIGFGDTWIWLAIVIFVAAVGAVHALLFPRLKRVEGLLAGLLSAVPPAGAGGPPPQGAELARVGRQVGIISTALNLATLVILILMVTKPGIGG
ncbi:MAG: DUF2269 family protein [Acidimicrobiia bacterium]